MTTVNDRDLHYDYSGLINNTRNYVEKMSARFGIFRGGVLRMTMCTLIWLGLAASANAAESIRLYTDDYRIDAVPLVTDFSNPWSLEFLPDGMILVTEKDGVLFRIDPATGEREQIDGVPETRLIGQGGLMDVVAHPSFAENSLLYLTLATPVGDYTAVTRVARGRLDGNRLNDVEIIFTAEPPVAGGEHFGSALTFDDEGFLFITTGERGVRESAQSLDNHLGKVLRLTDDGRIPDDNPFVDQADAMPEIFTLGHRNAQSILIEPVSREVWSIEHGPAGGDEVNRLLPGANYGWPVIGYGREYGEDRLVGEATSREGIEEPVYYFDPSTGTAGATFYTGNVFDDWQNNLLIAGLSYRLITRLEIRNGEVVDREDIYIPGRIRDLEEGPDGLIYALMDAGILYQLRRSR